MEYNRSDIRNIAFEAINERFSRGKYLGIAVTIDMTTGYINGSHLVGQVLTPNGKPKLFKNWKRGNEAQEFIEYLQSAQNRAGQLLLVEVVDVANELKGTYVHPELVLHLAQWASSIFAHKVAVIINDKAISEAIAEKNKLLQIKDDKIDELTRKVDELLRYASDSKKSNEDMQNSLDNAELVHEELADELFGVKAELGAVTVHLGLKTVQFDRAVERRVPPESRRATEELLELYGNGQGAYRAIRCQERSRRISVERCRHLGYTVLAFSKYDPNAISIFNLFKRYLPATIGTLSHGNIITLAPGATEADLVNYIAAIDGLRRVV